LAITSCGGAGTKLGNASTNDAGTDSGPDGGTGSESRDGADSDSPSGADGSADVPSEGDATDGSATAGGDAADGGPRSEIFVSPKGSDAELGTVDHPVQTLQRAQQLVRTQNADMTSDIHVILADGYYRMASPLTLDASDSGTGGHDVVWTAAAGARPVLMGSVQLTGWSPAPDVNGVTGVWVAQGPAGLKTRQLYVDGKRATRATTQPTPPVVTLGALKDPSGAVPMVELLYNPGQWAEARCPLASTTGGVIALAQPCSDNSTIRTGDNAPPPITGPPTRAENAYDFIDDPGEWYLDLGSGKVYYKPLAGQVMSAVDVEAPVLEVLVTGGGTAAAPLHNVVFEGLQFSYATWMGSSSNNGFSEVQANHIAWGPGGIKTNGVFDWFQIPANVALTYAQNIRFTGNAFVHLGAAGLGLGNGVQSSLVEGNVVTDTSGNAIEIGDDDMRNAVGADQTAGITVRNNHVFDAAVEYHGGVGIYVGYAANTSIVHNQVDHTPYTGISIGWGGWPDQLGRPGLANYAHDNDVSFNLIFDVMQLLSDGGAIYSNGQTSTSQSYADGLTVTGNVIHDLKNPFWAIYDDNGTDWMTVTGNAVWNTVSPWGYCHMDYYSGENGGLDNQTIHGNYWQGMPDAPGPSSRCVVSDNVSITGPADVPTQILNAAGLEPAFASVLSWTEVPPPPVP
jgi:hypothetical protein